MIEAVMLSPQEGDRNALGQVTYELVEKGSILGFLDMLAGNEAERATALSTSSHVFLTKETKVSLSTKDRLRILGKEYEVTYVDDPVNLGHHLEIYLKVAS